MFVWDLLLNNLLKVGRSLYELQGDLGYEPMRQYGCEAVRGMVEVAE